MQDTVVLDGKCNLEIIAGGDCNLDTIVDGEFGEYTTIESSEMYTGATTVTPSTETQTLPTQGLVMPSDVTVAPIPSNYGKITWDGSVLTVS